MLIFDASSIIYAWDNYPPDIFPPLWKWLAKQVSTNQITMSAVALDEVQHISPDCAQWLKDNDIERHAITNEILQESMRIKALLGIVNDRYGIGVGENDVFIISTALLLGVDLVSEEARQQGLPKVLANYKIPAVCNMQDVGVDCINFLDYIKSSGVVFR